MADNLRQLRDRVSELEDDVFMLKEMLIKELFKQRRANEDRKPPKEPVDELPAEVPVLEAAAPVEGHHFMNKQQAARYLLVGGSAIKKYIEDGRLPVRWSGKRAIIDSRDLDALADSLKVKGGKGDAA